MQIENQKRICNAYNIWQMLLYHRDLMDLSIREKIDSHCQECDYCNSRFLSISFAVAGQLPLTERQQLFISTILYSDIADIVKTEIEDAVTEAIEMIIAENQTAIKNIIDAQQSENDSKFSEIETRLSALEAASHTHEECFLISSDELIDYSYNFTCSETTKNLLREHLSRCRDCSNEWLRVLMCINETFETRPLIIRKIRLKRHIHKLGVVSDYVVGFLNSDAPNIQRIYVTSLVSIIVFVSFIFINNYYFADAYREPAAINSSNENRHIEIIDKLQFTIEKKVSPSTSRSEFFQIYLSAFLQAFESGNKDRIINTLSISTSTAMMIHTDTKDRFCLDTLSYYQSLPREYVREHIQGRALIDEVLSESIDDKFEASIQKLKTAEVIFEKFNASCELERIESLLARLYLKTGQKQEAKSFIYKGIKKASAKSHYLVTAELYIRKGELHGLESEYDDSVSSFKQSLSLGRELLSDRQQVSVIMAIVGILHNRNEDIEAFEYAMRYLKDQSYIINHQYTSGLLQCAGVSAFKLGHTNIADTFLSYSIEIARQQKSNSYQATGCSFLSVLRTEENRFSEAHGLIKEAYAAVNRLHDQNARIIAEPSIIGYNAKLELKSGNAAKAEVLYKKSISIADANGFDDLMLSQLHRGLGQTLEKRGDYSQAAEENNLAVNLEKNAKKQSIFANDLLAYCLDIK